MTKSSIQVAIILGSTSDEKEFENSKAIEVLDACHIPWELSIISAHRHPDDLESYCANCAWRRGVEVFIAGAGLAAALPGAIAAAIRNLRLVFGVPLAGGEWNGMDALAAMQSLPPGTVVGVQKFGSHGFTHAAIMAAQAISIKDEGIRERLLDYLRDQADKKPAEIGKRYSPQEDECR